MSKFYTYSNLKSHTCYYMVHDLEVAARPRQTLCQSVEIDNLTINMLLKELLNLLWPTSYLRLQSFTNRLKLT